MEISVIVPIYRVEDYIERCLRSLFTQTKTDGVEFILVNDATPDRSMEIARRIVAEYPNLNIQIIEHEKNRHIAATRQTGLDAATGEYTIQIDSDDWCEPTMLEDMYAKAIETDADIVYCDAFLINERKKHYKCEDNIELIKLSLDSKGKKINVTLWNKLIRRRVFLDNEIRVNSGLRRMEDWLTIIKVYLFAKKIAYLPNAYYHYTPNNPNSIMNNLDKYGFGDIAKAIILLEDFMKQHNCHMFDSIIRDMKVKYKISWMRDVRGKRQRECINSFPEIDKYILTSSKFKAPTKVSYYLMLNGFVPLANMIFNLSNWYHSKNQKL